MHRPAFDALLMVKPQFEVGRERVGKQGVVRDAEARKDAVRSVVAAAAEQGWAVIGLAPAGLPGPKGNVETFVHFAEAGREGAAPELTPSSKRRSRDCAAGAAGRLIHDRRVQRVVLMSHDAVHGVESPVRALLGPAPSVVRSSASTRRSRARSGSCRSA